jgi:hypothetical protein
MHAYEEGAAAYERGAYEAAIRAFEHSYAITRDPELLFDIAQAYRHKPGGCTQALTYLRQYEQLLPQKRDSVASIDALTSACAQAEVKPVEPVHAPLPAIEANPAGEAPLHALDSDRHSRAWLYWLGGGAAALVAGSVAVWSVTWDDDCRPACSPSQIDGFRLRLYVGYGLWAAGGAASALGLALWLKEAPRPGRASRRSWIAPTGSGLMLGGTF